MRRSLDSLPESGSPIAIDPAWSLAAWSVDNNGTLAGNRSTTLAVAKIFQEIGEGGIAALLDAATYETEALTWLPIMQTLSVIDFKTTTYANEQKAAAADSITHPYLYRTADIYAWAYGMTSRTAYLGAIVAILGCIVVIVQVILALADRRETRSITQVLVAALEHRPKGEFEGISHHEAEIARVTFRIRNADHTAGKLTFHSQHHDTSDGDAAEL